MQIKKILLTGILCVCIFYVQGQESNKGRIMGKVSDAQSTSIPFATIILIPLNKTIVSTGHRMLHLLG